MTNLVLWINGKKEIIEDIDEIIKAVKYNREKKRAIYVSIDEPFDLNVEITK